MVINKNLLRSSTRSSSLTKVGRLGTVPFPSPIEFHRLLPNSETMILGLLKSAAAIPVSDIE